MFDIRSVFFLCLFFDKYLDMCVVLVCMLFYGRKKAKEKSGKPTVHDWFCVLPDLSNLTTYKHTECILDLFLASLSPVWWNQIIQDIDFIQSEQDQEDIFKYQNSRLDDSKTFCVIF